MHKGFKKATMLNKNQIKFFFIHPNVEIRGKKRADQLAVDAVENGIEWHAPVRPPDFLPGKAVGRLAE
jgi:hypothetical protein